MNIAVITGGHHHEHDISLLSAETCIQALEVKSQVTKVVISRDLRTWQIDQDLLTPMAALQKIKASCDVALLMLHGPFGEDGTIQGALETAGIPYTGSGVQSSAIANNKLATNRLLTKEPNFHIPECALIAKGELNLAEQIADNLSYPLVLKPIGGGSSVETFFIQNVDELKASLNDADSSLFIAQKLIKGTELTCGVIDIEGTPKALDVIEIVPPEDGFFDYKAKYTAGASQEILPARITKEQTHIVQELSVAAHLLIGCSGITRSDFILDSEGLAWFLEINTIPGMTATSLVPQELAAADLDLGDVLVDLCKQGMKR